MSCSRAGARRGTSARKQMGLLHQRGCPPMALAFRRLLRRFWSAFTERPLVAQAKRGAATAAPSSDDLLATRIAAIAAALLGEMSPPAGSRGSRPDFRLPARLAFTARCCARPNRARPAAAKRTGHREWRATKARGTVAVKKVTRRHVWLGARGMTRGREAKPSMAALRQPAPREVVLSRLAA